MKACARRPAARTAAAMPAASQPVNSEAGLRACELKRALIEYGFGRGAFPHEVQWLMLWLARLPLRGQRRTCRARIRSCGLTGFPFQPEAGVPPTLGHLEARAV